MLITDTDCLDGWGVARQQALFFDCFLSLFYSRSSKVS